MSSWWTVKHYENNGLSRGFGIEEVLAVNATQAAEEAVKTWLHENSYTVSSVSGAEFEINVHVHKTGESDVTPLLRLRVKAKLEWTARAEPLPPDRVTDAAGPTR